MILHRKP